MELSTSEIHSDTTIIAVIDVFYVSLQSEISIVQQKKHRKI